MSKNNETIADIVTQFREMAHKSVDGIIAVKADVIADRLEAAAKREREEVVSTLSAPMRNCDRFKTADEAWNAYDEWVESFRVKRSMPPYNVFGWFFAPAAERKGERTMTDRIERLALYAHGLTEEIDRKQSACAPMSPMWLYYEGKKDAIAQLSVYFQNAPRKVV